MVISTHLPPPVIIESTAALAFMTHIFVLELRDVFFGRDRLRKRPGQHELRLEDGTGLLNYPVKGRRHPADHRVLDPPLHLRNDVPGIALEPMPIKGFGHEAKLNNEIVEEVLRLGLAAFLAP